MVQAYISTEIALFECVGYPVNDSGKELIFPKREKKPKVLPGQTTLIEEDKNGN